MIFMRRTDKLDGSEGLAQPVVHGDSASTMPEAFAGMYQTGYNDGYTSGQESGFRKGFKEGYAAAHTGPSGVAVTASTGAASAPKGGLQRMLLGLPCARCGAYFDRDETNCTACGLPTRELFLGDSRERSRPPKTSIGS
jgi:hypothetical protein